MLKNYFITVTLTGLLCSCAGSSVKNTSITPPIAKKIAHTMTVHGHSRKDEYYWMRDDKRQAPEVLAHLKAENDYTHSKLAHTSNFQKTLFEELTGRIEKNDDSVPYLYNGYWYQNKYENKNEYKTYYHKQNMIDAKYDVLLDVNKLAVGHDYFAIGAIEKSKDNKILAYTYDNISRRVYTAVFKDIQSGRVLEDKLTGLQGSIVWANDNKTVFYIKKDLQTLLGYQIFRHKLGTPQSSDVLVYEENDRAFYTGIGKSDDQSTLYIFHSSTSTSGVSILDANNPLGQFKPFYPLKKGVRYSVSKLNDYFYIRTNEDAKNFKLMKVQRNHTANKSKWISVIAARNNAYLVSYTLFNDYLVLQERIKGQVYMRVISNNTGKVRTIPFNDPIYVAYGFNNFNPDSKYFRVIYSSMTTPSTYYDINLQTFDKIQLKQTKVIGNFHPTNYVSERVFINARDGKKIPVSLVYRKNLFKKDGSNPLYQYGYGSYGNTIEPWFSISRLSLLDRGFVYAIAHVRGGKMLGELWYEDGKMFNKKNSFNDFIDVSKALVAQNYGAKDKIFAAGGSAGGLLMGAVINDAPELYKGIAAHVPFVDVVTTMLDSSIPLTTNEYEEWGHPNDQKSYNYMLSYSPYDQVKRQSYPNMLVTTGLHDSQVQYFEPAKWVAKLRDFKTDNNTLLFDIDMKVGHGGASGRFESFKKTALEYAFFMDLIGINK